MDHVAPIKIDQWHPHYDEQKIGSLVESLEADGWDGLPILVDGDQALTGAHRIEASRRAEMDAIPVKEVAEAIEEFGEDPLEYRDGWGGYQFQQLREIDGFEKYGEEFGEGC